MNILKALIIFGLTSFASFLSLIPKVSANDIALFTFKRYSNRIWIEDIRVEQGVMDYQENGGISSSYSGSGATAWRTVTGEAIKIIGNFGIPKCRNQYHTEGSIVVKYTNGNAYVTRSLRIDRYNQDKFINSTWTVGGYYGDPDDGKIEVETTLNCVYHGVNNRGGFSWVPWNW